MKTRYGMLLIAGTFAAALVVSGCGKKDANGQNAAKNLVTVGVEVVKPQPLTDALEATGIVKAAGDVTVSPEEGGVVRQWNVEKGQRVSKGEIVGLLKDDILKPSYEAADAQYQTAELNVQKQGKVFAEQGISELQFKSLQYGRDAAKAGADLMKARWEHTRLKSPIDGILEDRYREVGELAPPGVPLFRVVDASRVKIQAEVPEKFAGQVRTGMAARLTLDAIPGDSLTGTVTYVSSTVSSANRTLQVEIRLPNPGLRLKPEMVARVRLLREKRNNAVLVNENVVQLVDRDRQIVFVEVNGKAQERHVTLGGRQGNRVEVASGLNPGDRLVVLGYQKLVDGQSVAVAE